MGFIDLITGRKQGAACCETRIVADDEHDGETETTDASSPGQRRQASAEDASER